MSFRQAKQRVLRALRSGRIAHEARSAQSEKNKLACGDIGLQEAITIVECAQGPGEHRPHEQVLGVAVWIFKPVAAGKRWYIKFYLVDEDAVFISFHEAE